MLLAALASCGPSAVAALPQQLGSGKGGASRSPVKGAASPLNIGTSLQLVAVDDRIVASTANLTTTMHSPDVSRVAIESNPGFAIST